MSVGCAVSRAAARRCCAAIASSPWYSVLYGTAMNRPSGPRRMVVKKPVARAFSRRRQRADPLLHFRLGRAVGIVIRRRRLRRRAGNERLVVIEPRPRPLVDQEVVQPRLAERRSRRGSASKSIASLPAHTCSRNSASMTCAARTMCASAWRSLAGSAVMSAVRSVGAKRADFGLQIGHGLVDRRRRRGRRRRRRLRPACCQCCD